MYRINYILPLILLLSACVTVEEGGSKNERASKINVQLGIGYYHRGNLELANEKLVKALTQDPSSSQAHHAYAVLQNRFLDVEKTEFHFRKAIQLDPKNSEALSNFGAFLCKDGRYQEAEKMFLQAIENPIYRSPEVAYTSAAVCVLKISSDQLPKAKQYLRRALTLGNNYRPALINLADVSFSEKNTEFTQLYLDRYHLSGEPTARSLWLNIQNELSKGETSKIDKLAEKLKQNFPESKEYELWLALEK